MGLASKPVGRGLKRRSPVPGFQGGPAEPPLGDWARIGTRQFCRASAHAALEKAMQRLAHVRAAVATPVRAPAAAEGPLLLSDAEMQQFVATGFLVLPLGQDDDEGISHRQIHREARRLWKSRGEASGAGLGNNIYPAIPQLGAVMNSRRVDGALRSLLGDGYTMNAHRHMHNSTNQGQQSFHKDSQRGKPPNHLPRSCFVFYFPAGCTETMGPTEIVPTSHLLSSDNQDWSAVNKGPEMLAPHATSTKLTSPAHQPVAVISHHAMIHRGCGRLEDEDDDASPWRPMFKFIFSRGSGGAPKWNHDPGSVRPFAQLTSEPALVPAMEATWDWLLEHEDRNHGELPSQEEVDKLHAVLIAPKAIADEAQRVGASYTLGRYAQRGSKAALAALLSALSSPTSSEAARRVAAPGLQAAGSAAVDGLCETLSGATDYRVLMYGADALGEACRTPTVAVVDVLLSTIEKLEQMSVSSSRLLAWAGGEKRQQWDFAEDTAIASCATALSKIADRTVRTDPGQDYRHVWAALREFYLAQLQTNAQRGISGLVSLAAAAWAPDDSALVGAIYDTASLSGPQALVHTALGGVQTLSAVAEATRGGSKVTRIVRNGLLHTLSFERWSDPRDDPRQPHAPRLAAKPR